MEKCLHVKLLTPERVVFEEDVDQISVSTETGEITVLPGHISLVSVLKPGEVRTKKREQEELMAISSGFIEVRGGDQVVILADTAERAEELDAQAIADARTRAQEALSGARKTEDVEYAAAYAALERELARERVVLKRKHKK